MDNYHPDMAEALKRERQEREQAALEEHLREHQRCERALDLQIQYFTATG